ncbi:hypothetical protein VVR12_01735 [Rothia sp. LK2588]|uniref:hypothetical protein n=1 Tax=Rothia sp. LK2588 TaxID=3114369 RepID=UPI0034CD79F5
METTDLLTEAEIILAEAKRVAGQLAFDQQAKDSQTQRINALTALAAQYIDLYRAKEIR